MSTEPFWQVFAAPEAVAGPPYADRFPARVSDDRVLELPLRVLPGDGDRAVASLIINHAAFPVIEWFCRELARRSRHLVPEVVVGLPTLGLMVAPGVAQNLGLPHFVPMGYSRKFWYDDALSESVSSVTTPTQDKRLYLDPNLVSRIAGRRVVIVDDVVSRGTTIAAARRLLDRLGVQTVGALTIMAQTERWKSVLGDLPLVHLFSSPLFERRADGWWPL